jgi:CheY-like chemotaxis protein
VSARDRARRRSILVVDDEGGTIDVLIAVLADAGYVATGASNGQEALAQLRGTLPDLVLLDLEMPVLDGAGTLRAIAADPRLAALNVVLMSGIPESMVKRRCRGHRAFLRKPFSLDELLETVAELARPATPNGAARAPSATAKPAPKSKRTRAPRAAKRRRAARAGK